MHAEDLDSLLLVEETPEPEVTERRPKKVVAKPILEYTREELKAAMARKREEAIRAAVKVINSLDGEAEVREVLALSNWDLDAAQPRPVREALRQESPDAGTNIGSAYPEGEAPPEEEEVLPNGATKARDWKNMDPADMTEAELRRYKRWRDRPPVPLPGRMGTLRSG